jgi:6-phosphofructokinase 1
MVAEVMGRHAGWLALESGLAGGADMILIPERPFDLDEVCDRLRHHHTGGASYSVVVVAEGAQPLAGTLTVQDAGVDEFGHARLGGIASALGPEIEARTGFETRVTILGHVLRGGTPTAYDRILATRRGLAAVDAVHEEDFATMVALRGTDIVRVALVDALRELKTVPPALLDEVAVCFG